MPRTTFRPAAVLLLALVTACGGGVESGSTGTDEAPGITEPTAAPAAAPDDGDAETLADFMGFGGEDAEVDFRDQDARIQEAIRVCMAEEGFDYIPVVPPDDAFQVWDQADEEERVRSEGFGITTWFGKEDQFGGGTEWVDPNQERLEAMSETELKAWEEALYGTEEEQAQNEEETVDEETGETVVMMDRFGMGCWGAAYEEEFGGASVDELWEELNPAFEAMYERVQADPRIVEANAEWAACMAGAGFDGLASRDDMWESVYDDFNQRFEAIVGESGGFADPFEGWSEDEINTFFEEKTEEEVNAFIETAQGEIRDSVDQEALAALQQEEIDMAVADWECGEDINDLYTEVSEEYERDFIAENRALLEQIRDAQGG